MFTYSFKTLVTDSLQQHRTLYVCQTQVCDNTLLQGKMRASASSTKEEVATAKAPAPKKGRWVPPHQRRPPGMDA